MKSPRPSWPRQLGLQHRLTLTYAAVGIMIAMLCLGATAWIQGREEAQNIGRAEAIRLAEEIGTRIDSAYEESLTYELTGDRHRKEKAFLELGLLAGDYKDLRALALSARAAAQMDDLERAMATSVRGTRQLLEERDQSIGWRVDGERFVAFEESMDALSGSGERLLPVIRHLAATDAAASARLIRWSMFFIGLVGILAATLLGHLLGRAIVRPLQHLRDAAVGFGHGRFDLALDVSGGDEIGDLSRAFDGMATNVRGLMASIAAQRAHLEDIFESMTELLIVCGDDGIIASANRSACATLGYQPNELRGRHLKALLQSTSFEELHRRASIRVSPTSVVPAEVTLMARDNRPIPALGSVTILATRPGGESSSGALLLVLQDLRERQQLESDLRQAQKLEAIGRLASGIAHEINTPIQFLTDSLGLLAEASRDLLAIVEKYRQLPGLRPEAAADLLRETAEMEATLDYPYMVAKLPVAVVATSDGLKRIADIVSSMKQFAHPGQAEPVPCDLNAGVASTITIARSEYKYVADLQADLGELPPVVCHLGELNQVVLNLLVNAAHAIAEVGKDSDRKGRIVVRTRCDGQTVVITVSDSGGGIPEAARDRIFDPFFTTKEVGKGTGQGLAIARSVVAKHGGTITFQTELGKGTTFFVRLPANGVAVKTIAAA